MENIEKDSVDKAADAIVELAKSGTITQEAVKAVEAKMDEILKTQANLNKAFIRSNEEEKEVGKFYNLKDAQADIAKGKTAKVPYWDPKTSKSFNSYIKMVYNKDYDGIAKAFGDNVQDGGANYTPTEFKSEIIRLEFLSSMALQKGTIIPMSRDKVTIPAPTGNYTVSWLSAGAAILDSKFTQGVVTLDSAKLAALALVNQEDLDDEAFPLASYIAQQMGEDFGQKIDEEVFQGDVSDTTNHAFDGWEYASSVEAVTGAVDATPKFAELLTEDNLLAMVAKLDDRERNGAEWFFTNEAWNVIRAIEDGAGSKIIRLNENYQYELLGYPVNLNNKVGVGTATAGRAAGFFGNMKWIYIGDRMNFSIATSDQYRFANDQIVFRGIQRLAVAVALPSALCKISFGASS